MSVQVGGHLGVEILLGMSFPAFVIFLCFLLAIGAERSSDDYDGCNGKWGERIMTRSGDLCSRSHPHSYHR